MVPLGIPLPGLLADRAVGNRRVGYGSIGNETTGHQAILADPKILILDEATAMFDPAGEEKFIKNNIQVLDNLTVIIITHRPASLALADIIYELKEGKLRKLN